MTVIQAMIVHDGEGEEVVELTVRIYPKEAAPLLALIEDATSGPRKERDTQIALPFLKRVQEVVNRA